MTDTLRSRTYLKDKYETGDIPIASDYNDWITTMATQSGSNTFSPDPQTFTGDLTINNNLTVYTSISSPSISADYIKVNQIDIANLEIQGYTVSGDLVVSDNLIVNTSISTPNISASSIYKNTPEPFISGFTTSTCDSGPAFLFTINDLPAGLTYGTDYVIQASTDGFSTTTDLDPCEVTYNNPNYLVKILLSLLPAGSPQFRVAAYYPANIYGNWKFNDSLIVNNTITSQNLTTTSSISSPSISADNLFATGLSAQSTPLHLYSGQDSYGGVLITTHNDPSITKQKIRLSNGDLEYVGGETEVAAEEQYLRFKWDYSGAPGEVHFKVKPYWPGSFLQAREDIWTIAPILSSPTIRADNLTVNASISSGFVYSSEIFSGNISSTYLQTKQSELILQNNLITQNTNGIYYGSNNLTLGSFEIKNIGGIDNDNWKTISSVSGPIVNMDASGKYQFICGSGSSYYSTDYGTTWASTSAVDSAAYSSDSTHIYATSSTSLVKSTDYGQNWSTIPTWTSGTIKSLKTTPDGKNILTSTGDGGTWGDIYISKDYGDTWEIISPDSTQKYNGIAFNSTGQHIYVNTHPAQTNGFKRSHDYGKTWVSTGTKSDNAIYTDDSGKYVLAADVQSGIKYSKDYGVNWSQIDLSGYEQQAVITGPGSTLFGGTHTGLYVSKDYGANWNLVRSGNVQSVASSYNGKYVLANISDTIVRIVGDEYVENLVTDIFTSTKSISSPSISADNLTVNTSVSSPNISAENIFTNQIAISSSYTLTNEVCATETATAYNQYLVIDIPSIGKKGIPLYNI